VGDPTFPYARLLARLTPQSRLSFWKGQAAALTMVAVATGLRRLLDPVLGDDVSFTTLFPALLVSTMLAGAPGAVTTIVGGSIASLAFSALGDPTPQVIREAVPRLVVWLLVSGLVTAISLALRATMFALRTRQIELVEAKERQEVLTRELEHRGRNALTIAQALSSMTARSVDSVEAYRREFARRIVALSDAYSLLLDEPTTPQPLDGVVRKVLAGFGAQICITGDASVLAAPNVCVSLALALHELATNAVKYGALSRPCGTVDLQWVSEAGGTVFLQWRESGGPVPSQRRSGGVGSQTIRQAFLGVPGASPELTIGPGGVLFNVRIPCQSATVERGPGAPQGGREPAAPQRVGLLGRSARRRGQERRA